MAESKSVRIEKCIWKTMQRVFAEIKGTDEVIGMLMQADGAS
jgi:hypothetical protein